MLLARSAPEGEADETGVKADVDTRRSAVGGRADVVATWPESPLLAISGLTALGNGMFILSAWRFQPRSQGIYRRDFMIRLELNLYCL